MNPQTILTNFINIDGIDIDEGEHSLDGQFERVEFTHRHLLQSGYGQFGFRGDNLEFDVTYNIEGEVFDIEHSLSNGVEHIAFSNLNNYDADVTFKHGIVANVTIFDAEGGKRWIFAANSEQRFLQLVCSEPDNDNPSKDQDDWF